MKDAAPLSLGYGMGWQNEEIFSRSNKTKHEVETSVLERNLRRGSERATAIELAFETPILNDHF